MENDDIRRLVDLMRDHDLVELEIEQEGRRVKLRKREPNGRGAEVPPPPVAGAPPAPAPAAPADGVVFKSPLVGTFYRGPKPEADPYVDVGDAVTAEKVLCIVEAMKVMNEIKAEMSGTIREVLVKNGQAVQFGEPLFLIDPA